MSSKKKSTLFGRFSRDFFIALIIIVVTFVGALWSVNRMSFGPESKEATLLLAFENDGKGRMFTGEVIGDMTILDALIASSEAGQIKLRYTVSVDGKTIISGLNGYDADLIDKKIVFYLDQKRIETERVNSIVIRPGDNIEVRLE